jgi:NADPH-dependent FMN reductase
MSRTLAIVGLGGSLAEVSRSRAAMQVTLDGAAEAGAETALLDLRELDLPMYNPGAAGFRIGPSSCSSEPWAARSCVSPSGSPTTARSIAGGSASKAAERVASAA